MEVLGLFIDLLHVNALNILIDDHVKDHALISFYKTIGYRRKFRRQTSDNMDR